MVKQIETYRKGKHIKTTIEICAEDTEKLVHDLMPYNITIQELTTLSNVVIIRVIYTEERFQDILNRILDINKARVTSYLPEYEAILTKSTLH